MKEIDQKINEYKSGDSEKRLNLFLTYRSLRPIFAQIDHEKEVCAISVKWENKEKIENDFESEEELLRQFI